MSIPINDTLAPRTTGYKLIDDSDVGGGLHVVVNTAARDAIPTEVLKVGMLVYTQSDDKYWKLLTLTPTWEEFSVSSGGNGVVLWSAGKTWDDVWSEIQSAGGYAIVLIPSASIVTVTGVGPYDLLNISFVGLGERSELDFDIGVLIDGGSTVVLNADNLLVYGQAPLMTPGSKAVQLSVVRSLLSNYASSDPLFSSSSPNNTIFLHSGSITVQAGATELFDLTDAAASLFVTVIGGGYSPQQPAIIDNSMITGVAGADVRLLTDALGQYDSRSIVASPVTVTALSGDYGRLGLPNYATVALPTPSVYRTGQVAWDTTDMAAKICTGSNWLHIASTLPVYSDGSRPAANTVPVGTLIYNTNDNAPNVSDGTNWRNMSGAIT